MVLRIVGALADVLAVGLGNQVLTMLPSGEQNHLNEFVLMKVVICSKSYRILKFSTDLSTINSCFVPD